MLNSFKFFPSIITNNEKKSLEFEKHLKGIGSKLLHHISHIVGGLRQGIFQDILLARVIKCTRVPILLSHCLNNHHVVSTSHSIL